MRERVHKTTHRLQDFSRLLDLDNNREPSQEYFKTTLRLIQGYSETSLKLSVNVVKDKLKRLFQHEFKTSSGKSSRLAKD